MSEDPLHNSATNGETALPNVPQTGGGNSENTLQLEIERLRKQLAKVTAEAESYRRAAYSLLNKEVPYTPPSEEELEDLLHGPRGKPILDIIGELECEGDG